MPARALRWTPNPQNPTLEAAEVVKPYAGVKYLTEPQDAIGAAIARNCPADSCMVANANRVAANVQNCLPPDPRVAHSTNRAEPRPHRQMIAANGQPIDARTHIANDQAWRARNRLDEN